METNSRAKFVKLANRRTNNVIKHLRLVGNLSNKSNYSYSEKDYKKILDVLKKELEICEERFAINFTRDNKEFRIED